MELRSVRLKDHGFGTAAIAAGRLPCSRTGKRVRSGLKQPSLKDPVSAEQAEADKRNRFAVRASSILAFIECDDELRPKLREAIVDAMLWAQTQP